MYLSVVHGFISVALSFLVLHWQAGVGLDQQRTADVGGPGWNPDVCDAQGLYRHQESLQPLTVTQRKNLDLMMQLDRVSKLLPAAWARVSDIQLLQALWCFSHISLLPSPSGRQHSHFHMKLPRHFCWKLTP